MIPEPPTEGRLRLTILGGFLGSGKTTWLRHQLHVGAYPNAHVIVNEAAETPVDDALLAPGAAALTVLAGGCVCCTGQADLIALLRRLCDARTRAGQTHRLDQIVLETSGLADPGPIVAAIRADPVLVHHIVLTEVIVTVDGLHGLSQLREEALGRRQVEIADRLILTKLDAVAPDGLARLRATLAAINPGAEQSGTVKGTVVPLPPVDPSRPPDPPSEFEARPDAPPIFPTQIALDDSIDWTAFSVWLSALLHARGDQILRVKGVIRTPGGRLLLQTVRKVVQSPEILPDQTSDAAPRKDGVIVILGRGYDGHDLHRSLRHFTRAGRSTT